MQTSTTFRCGHSIADHRAVRISLFLLSAATLAFEINLTRLFSVAQFYHFAFMIVSIALLGFGASGSALAIFPFLVRKHPQRSLGWLSLATSAAILAAYLLTNQLPFDSFSIAWDRRQVWILVLHYVALAAPFFFSGMAVGLLLAANPQASGGTYATNLFGSAVGCIIALLAPVSIGGEGMVTLSSGIATLGALIALISQKEFRMSFGFIALALLLFSLYDLGTRISGRPTLPLLELHLSPYKSLAYALQYPDTKVIYHRWNAFSRVDVVQSDSIHSLPGLSYRYLQRIPAQNGLLVDGDDLSAVLIPDGNLTFSEYLPSAIAFQLRPKADTLILEPRGGLDILTALSMEAGSITAVEVNPLIVEATPIYDDPRLKVVVESDRSYLRRTANEFDVILLSLSSSYHPVRSGAYALGEDYRFTVESFEDALIRLAPHGLLIFTRWLQNPPSEDLRAFALSVSAVEQAGGDPAAQIVAFRGYNTVTILVKNAPFSDDELLTVRAFTASRAFDLTYMPDIQPQETNQYNILPEPIYYEAYTALLTADPRKDFYQKYPFDVTPPTDDHPFFGHYFKWSQAGQILAELGKTWQPFGGAGYFVILALLLLANLLSSILILLPVAIRQNLKSLIKRGGFLAQLTYFGLLGMAYLLVEIPLIQRFILYLDQPAHAFTSVIFALLVFSALGSRLSRHVPLRSALLILTALLLIAPFALPTLFTLTLGLSLTLRMGITTFVLAPIGFLMGIPFPAMIRQMEPQSIQISWVWAVNGAASVVASVLAALLALSLGFNWVLWLGAVCYAGAWFTVWARQELAHS